MNAILTVNVKGQTELTNLCIKKTLDIMHLLSYLPADLLNATLKKTRKNTEFALLL
jgi:hypothetical protein